MSVFRGQCTPLPFSSCVTLLLTPVILSVASVHFFSWQLRQEDLDAAQVEKHDYRSINLGREVHIQILIGFLYGPSLISEGEGKVVFACSVHLNQLS